MSSAVVLIKTLQTEEEVRTEGDMGDIWKGESTQLSGQAEKMSQKTTNHHIKYHLYTRKWNQHENCPVKTNIYTNKLYSVKRPFSRICVSKKHLINFAK